MRIWINFQKNEWFLILRTIRSYLNSKKGDAKGNGKEKETEDENGFQDKVCKQIFF